MKLKYIRWFSQNKEMYLKINNNVEEEMGIENISQKFQNESEIFLNKLMQKFSIHVMPRALQLIIHEKKNFLLQSLELQENVTNFFFDWVGGGVYNLRACTS